MKGSFHYNCLRSLFVFSLQSGREYGTISAKDRKKSRSSVCKFCESQTKGENDMLWDRAAWVYDIFADIINRKANKEMCAAVVRELSSSGTVLECACGTGLLSGAIAKNAALLSQRIFRSECSNGRRKNIETAAYVSSGRTFCTLTFRTKTSTRSLPPT